MQNLIDEDFLFPNRNPKSDEDWEKEFEIRTEEYENGTAKLVTFEELKREVIKVYEAKSKQRDD